MKFICRTIGNMPRTVEREAINSADAAEQCAKAMHSAYWSDYWRNGHDATGPYGEFTVMSGKQPVATVRVYNVE